MDRYCRIFSTMHDYNMVFGKFKWRPREKYIGQNQGNGVEHQVQRIIMMIIRSEGRIMRSEAKIIRNK